VKTQHISKVAMLQHLLTEPSSITYHFVNMKQNQNS